MTLKGHCEDLHLLRFVFELAAVGLPIEDNLPIGGQFLGYGQQNQLGMWFTVRFENDVLYGSLVRQASNRRFMLKDRARIQGGPIERIDDNVAGLSMQRQP